MSSSRAVFKPLSADNGSVLESLRSFNYEDDCDTTMTNSQDAIANGITSLPKAISSSTCIPMQNSTVFRYFDVESSAIHGKQQYLCRHCNYTTKSLSKRINYTSNLWKHLKAQHLTIWGKSSQRHYRPRQRVCVQSSPPSSQTLPSSPPTLSPQSSFFGPYPTRRSHTHNTTQESFRKNLLSVVASDNLLLRFVDSPALVKLVHDLNPSVLLISRNTLESDINKLYLQAKVRVKAELHDHLESMGRISLTTDSWSSKTRREYAAVTAHWINKDWQSKELTLGVIHLDEPIHGSEYMALKLFELTEEFEITWGVLAVTRDNAIVNDAMLREFERLSAERRRAVLADIDSDNEESARLHSIEIQPWHFKEKYGDTQCMAHAINIAVQVALKQLKAEAPTDNLESRVEEGILPQIDDEYSIGATMSKLRRHIYVFCNRRWWRSALEKQAKALDIKYLSLQHDMPVRWNSTFHMIDNALQMRCAIDAVCALQTQDECMKRIIITRNEWDLLEELARFFNLFVKTTIKLQASSYPMLSMMVPFYYKLSISVQKFKDTTTNIDLKRACAVASTIIDKYHTLSTQDNTSHPAIIATVCDPRLNINVFSNLFVKAEKGNIEGRKEIIKRQIERVYKMYRTRQGNVERALLNNPAITSDRYGKKHVYEIDSDEEIFKSNAQVAVGSEWQRWLHEPIASQDTDILNWWYGKASTYPIMSKIARDYLSIQATSTPSEQVFSTCGDILTRKRNRLGNRAFRSLIFLRSCGELTLEKMSSSVDEDSNSE